MITDYPFNFLETVHKAVMFGKGEIKIYRHLPTQPPTSGNIGSRRNGPLEDDLP